MEQQEKNAQGAKLVKVLINKVCAMMPVEQYERYRQGKYVCGTIMKATDVDGKEVHVMNVFNRKYYGKKAYIKRRSYTSNGSSTSLGVDADKMLIRAEISRENLSKEEFNSLIAITKKDAAQVIDELGKEGRND